MHWTLMESCKIGIFFFQMYTKKIIFEGFLNLLCWLNSFGWPTLADNTGGITIESNIGFHCRKMSRKSYYTIGSTAVTLSLVSSGTVFAGKTTHLLMDHPNTSKTYEKLLLPWSKIFSFTSIKGVNLDAFLSLFSQLYFHKTGNFSYLSLLCF